jgi:hypothetical protein
MKHILSPILLSLLLTACGGGGSPTPTPTSVIPILPATLYDTSYKNFKLNGTDSIKYPVYHLRWGGDPIAIGYGDFLKTGELSVFVAYQNYVPTDPYSVIQNNPTNYASEYVFYTVNSDKSLTKSISLKGCLHPRKAVVADFNKDGIADVFVACHGYDSSPFPGEKSQLVLSTGRGQYTITDIGDIAFTHGASAADVNNDGYPDLVVANGNNVYFYINQKNGSFIKDTTRILNLTLPLPYYNVELIDVDNDSKIDVVVGGHENQGATTKVLYGSDGVFGSKFLNIPAIQTKGTVNDYTLVNNILYVNRTTDSSSSLGWYNGLTIQSYNLNTGTSNIAADVSGNWVTWLLPKTKNNVAGVGSYNSSDFYQ